MTKKRNIICGTIVNKPLLVIGSNTNSSREVDQLISGINKVSI